MYVSSFFFPTEDEEWARRLSLKETCYQSMYPYFVLSKAGLTEIIFRPVTILYGGNGSGKSTALNVIAEKLRLRRSSAYNRSSFFEEYVDRCEANLEEAVPPESRIITSDDVFDMMLNIRSVNEGIDRRREEIIEEYYQLRGEKFTLRSMADYERLHRVNQARSKTKSRFADQETGRNIRERSNGESAMMYFRQQIENDTLCLLDEPENSLSPENTLLLADFLREGVRYCGCQLVISTHSPFLLALPGAKIIDLDHGARIVNSWTQLSNPRTYYEFFKQHANEFEYGAGDESD
ncbi:MAG: AAA family ATPase [Clostridia bacterium]|nr:AAA family ATPase [Clostridia bacterium]